MKSNIFLIYILLAEYIKLDSDINDKIVNI